MLAVKTIQFQFFRNLSRMSVLLGRFPLADLVYTHLF